MKKFNFLIALFVLSTVNCSELVGNSANAQGHISVTKGQIYNESSLVLDHITDATGGAFLNNQGDATIDNFKFTYDTAQNAGGAIYNNGDFKILNSYFEGNTATSTKYGGGAIYNAKNHNVTLINSTLKNNTNPGKGGAIYNATGGVFDIIESNLIGNHSDVYGGAIFNYGKVNIKDSYIQGNYAKDAGVIYNLGTLDIENSTIEENYSNTGAVHIVSNYLTTIKNSEFNGNYAHNDAKNCWGGALNLGFGNVEITNTDFIGNHADSSGAIHIALPQLNKGETVDDIAVNLTNVTLANSYSYWNGGAIGNYSKLTANNTTFENNESKTTESEGGGALFIGSDSHTTLNNVVFKDNKSLSNGGAIATRSSEFGYNARAKLDITNSKFINNKAAGEGGAIDNYFYGSSKGDSVVISNTLFEGNSAKDGGAIYNHAKGENPVKDAGDGAVFVTKSMFRSNKSTNSGGAIYNDSNIVLSDSSFVNNMSEKDGGAIYTTEDIIINAQNNDVVFSGNKAANGGDIYMNKQDGNIKLHAAADRSMIFDGGISGTSNNYNVIVNSNETDTGALILKSAINNAAMDVQHGMLHLAEGSKLNNTTINMQSGTILNTMNNQIDNYGNNLTLHDNVKVYIDVSVAHKTSDNFSNAIQKGKVTLENISIIDTRENHYDSLTIDLKETMGLENPDIDIKVSDYLLAQNAIVLNPIRYMQGSINSDSIINYGPTGNRYKDFNPAVMASSVAAQIGGYLTQLNSYDEAFRNMDMYMLMTKKERQALKNANKYADAGDADLLYSQISTPYSNKAGWFRPYTAFESIGMKNGPKVNNVAYGSYAGVESEIYDLGHGWDGIVSLYAGYNGSHQTYQGNSIYQNGGTLGLVGMAYKDNFFTGLTVNAGANIANADTMYGSEDFTLFMTGVASKSGYNFELADGKFIIQPNYLMAYSMINTFDYTNAADVRISSDPLHAITIAPGLKLIGNLNNGWQPYASISVIMNIMDKTQFKAFNVTLPELGVKPFVMYGLGVRKTWGKKFTGYLQGFISNGGRNGIGFQTGLRWTLGED